MHFLTHRLDRFVRILTIVMLLTGTFPSAILAEPPTGEPTPAPLSPPAVTPTPTTIAPDTVETVSHTLYLPLVLKQSQVAPPPTDTLTQTGGHITSAGGSIATPGNRLRLTFAPHAVQAPTNITISHPDLTSASARQSALANTANGTNGLPFHLFQFNAQPAQNTSAHLQIQNEVTETVTFDEPVTLTYTYTPQEIEGINETTLHFVYYNPQKKKFENIPSAVDTVSMQVTAVITHFSTYGVAGDTFGWMTPSVAAFSVAEARGQSTYSYPIPVPTGAGGLAPQLTLNYNSGIVNGMIGPKFTDTGWVGIGWTLDTGQIVSLRDDFGEIMLSFNGTSERAYRAADGTYYTQHQTQLKIERVGIHNELPTPSGCRFSNTGGAYRWKVTDQNGTTYYFGTEYSGGQRVRGSTLSYLHSVSSFGVSWNMRVYKLYRVEDVHGNRMEIGYNETSSNGCNLPVVSESYPSIITYTLNSNAGDALGEYTVEFNIASKGYNAAGGAEYGDGSKKLTQIVTKYHPNANSAQVIRTITFHYTTDATAKTNRLDSIQVSANGQNLPSTTFTYANKTVSQHWQRYGDCSASPNNCFWEGTLSWQRQFLTKAENGYGGRVEFTYQPAGACRYHPFQVVRLRTVTDNVSNTVGQYHYGFGGCNIQHQDPEKGLHFDYSHFHGFNQVTTTDPAGNVTRQYFNNDHVVTDGRDRDGILNGRELERWFYGPGGTALYQANITTWTAFDGSGWGWPTDVKFVAPTEKNTYQCNGLATNGSNNQSYLTNCIRQRSTFEYNVQYGQLTKQVDYNVDGVTPYRTTLWGFLKHPNKWLFRKNYKNIYQGGTTNSTTIRKSTWFTYDGHPTWDTPLSANGIGELTGVRHWKSDNTLVDTTYQHDAYGNITHQTQYANTGDNTHYATANPRTTVTDYDAQGILPVKVTDPLNYAITTTYDYRWQKPLSEKDANGNTTYYTYDNFGRLETVKLPAETGSFTYQATYASGTSFGNGSPYWERWTQHIETGDIVTYAFYDGFGRRIQTRSTGDTNTIVEKVVYDALGRVVQESIPLESTSPPNHYWSGMGSAPRTTTTYDPLGRKSVVTAPDGAETHFYYDNDRKIGANGVDDDTNNDGIHDVYGFHLTGQALTAIVDANGHVKHQITDIFGNLIRVREFSGSAYPWLTYAETTYNYDILGNLTGVTDTAGNHTTITYNKLGQKISMSDPDMGVWHYEYDNFNNLTAQQDARGQWLCFAYDKLNRLTGKKSGNNHTCTGGQTLATYTYDANSNRTTMTDAGGTVAYVYDARNRLTGETRTVNNGLGVFHTGYTYDNANRQTSITYPDGETVTTTYTPRGLPSRLSSSLGGDYIQNATYNVFGQPIAQTAGNNLVTQNTYNPLTGQLWRTQTGSLLNLGYAYDPVGNITAISDGSKNETLRYSYDHLDRLTGYQQDNSPAKSVTIRAKGSYADGWPQMQLRVNGVVVQEWTVSTGNWTNYTVSAPLTGNDQIDVVFTNDHCVATGCSHGDRNLWVDYVTVDGQTVQAEGGSTTIDRGASIKAFDGQDVIAGQQGIYWNGALRFRVGGQTLTDSFTLKNNAIWAYNSYQSIVNSTIKNSGTGNSWAANFYRKAYSLKDGDGLQVRFKVDRSDTFAHFSLEANDNTYRRFGVIANDGKIFVQYADNGHNWTYPKDLITNLQLNTWYVLTLKVDDSAGFLAEVYQENNPTARGYYRQAMPVGKQWRFHHWIYRGSANLDDYREFSQQTDGTTQSYQYNAIGNLTVMRQPNTLRNDTFDSTTLPAGWTQNGNVSVSSGQVHITGNNSWGNHIARSGTISDRQSAHYRFKANSNAVATLFVDTGAWAQPSYRRWGFYLDGNSIKLNTYEGTVSIKKNLLTLVADQWYDAVLTVNENGDFQAVVSKVSDPAIRAEITEKHNWGGHNWKSMVQVNSGTLDLDSYREEAPPFSYPASGANSVRPHAVTHINGTQKYWYDANGNMTTRTEDGITYHQTFNPENKLESVNWSDNSGNHSVTFTYDGDGNRLLKTQAGVTTVYIGNYYEKTGSAVTKYYYFGGQRVAMRDSSGVKYFHSDHLGSAILTTNGNGGGVYHQIRYNPYGSKDWSSGLDATDYDFTGQRLDNFGLLDYHARYYDATLGRFISPDSVVPDYGNPQDLNRYAYVRGNPVRFNDPSGHALDAGGAVGLEGFFQYYQRKSTKVGNAYGGNLSEYYTHEATYVLELSRGNSTNASIAAKSAENALFRTNVNRSLSSLSAVQRGVENPASQSLSNFAMSMDAYDATATTGLALLGIGGSLAVENPLPLLVADILKTSTTIVDIVGFLAIGTSDILSGRTAIATGENQLTVSVGTDTLATIISMNAGGGPNPDVVSSALVDLGQLGWDKFRMNGKIPYDSFQMSIFWGIPQ